MTTGVVLGGGVVTLTGVVGAGSVLATASPGNVDGATVVVVVLVVVVVDVVVVVVVVVVGAISGTSAVTKNARCNTEPGDTAKVWSTRSSPSLAASCERARPSSGNTDASTNAAPATTASSTPPRRLLAAVMPAGVRRW
jgi:hypothetical protein